ncbi:MAG: hypothetical protein RI897_3996 [Verrucomicrobiota bacterium]|jgi:hypothetical protein
MRTALMTASTLICVICTNALSTAATWNCTILPSEHTLSSDPASGARLIRVTSHNAADSNLYFHQRCFLPNNKLMLFYSDRSGRNEIMGYLLETGELIRFNTSPQPASGSPVASRHANRIFVSRNNQIYRWDLTMTTTPGTSVEVTETLLTSLPPGASQRSFIDENSNGTLLVYAYSLNDEHYLGFCSTDTGSPLPPTKLNFKPDHIQFHWTRPDLVAFNRIYGSDVAPKDPTAPRQARIWFLNTETRIPTPAFWQVPGEITTHECWWVNDQMTFIGGHHHEGSREEGHVKTLNLLTGDIQIKGAGAWIEQVTASQLAEVNWWHAAGSPNGKWIAADNWHGIIAIFNARTTERKTLTQGHRTYGSGHHLHVGWDTTGQRVEFTSNAHGNPDVYIAEIPKDWTP